MSTKDPDNGSAASKDHDEKHHDPKSPDSVASGAGPQADGDQSDIASGGGTDS